MSSKKSSRKKSSSSKRKSSKSSSSKRKSSKSSSSRRKSSKSSSSRRKSSKSSSSRSKSSKKSSRRTSSRRTRTRPSKSQKENYGYLDNIAAFGIMAQNEIYTNIDNAIVENFSTVSEQLRIDIDHFILNLYELNKSADKEYKIDLPKSASDTKEYFYNKWFSNYMINALDFTKDSVDFVIPTVSDIRTLLHIKDQSLLEEQETLQPIIVGKKTYSDEGLGSSIEPPFFGGIRKKYSKKKNKRNNTTKSKKRCNSNRKIKQTGGFICSNIFSTAAASTGDVVSRDPEDVDFLINLRNALENGFEPKHDFGKKEKRNPFPLSNDIIQRLFEDYDVISAIRYLGLERIWNLRNNFEILVLKEMINNNHLYPKIGPNKNQLYTWIGRISRRFLKKHLYWLTYDFETTDVTPQDVIDKDILETAIMNERFTNTNKTFVFLDGLANVYIQSFTDIIITNILGPMSVKSFLTKIWDPIAASYNIMNYIDNTPYDSLFKNVFRKETSEVININYNVSKDNVHKTNAIKINVIHNVPIIRNNGFSVNVISRAIHSLRENTKALDHKSVKLTDKDHIIKILKQLNTIVPKPNLNTIIRILLDLKKTGDWGQVCSARNMVILPKAGVDTKGTNPNIILITNDTLAALAAIADGVSLIFGTTFNKIKCLGIFNGQQIISMQTLGSYIQAQFQFTYGNHGLNTTSSKNIIKFIYEQIDTQPPRHLRGSVELLDSIYENLKIIRSLSDVLVKIDINTLPDGGKTIENFKNLLDKMNAYYYIYHEPTTIPYIIWTVYNNINKLIVSWSTIVSKIVIAPGRRIKFDTNLHKLDSAIIEIMSREYLEHHRIRPVTTMPTQVHKYNYFLRFIQMTIKKEGDIINNILYFIILSDKHTSGNVEQDIKSLINLGITAVFSDIEQKDIDKWINDNLKNINTLPPISPRYTEITTQQLDELNKKITVFIEKGSSASDNIAKQVFPLATDISNRLGRITEFINTLMPTTP